VSRPRGGWGFDRLVLAGCGKMGGALLEGWLARGCPGGALTVTDPSPAPETAALIAREGVALNPAAPAPADVLVVAVKPQVLDAALPGLAGWAGPRTLVVSVVAGKTIARFEQAFGASTPVVRTIPNTPAAVGRGMTVGVANAAARADDRALAERLLSAVGDFAWVDDEGLMDAATAVSGSGPAYVFHLVEALAAAGAAQGLPPELAAQLARRTVEGAGELLRQSTLDPARLRANVTSPAGTTAAALEHLMDPERGFPPLLARAVAAATRRGRELAG
jgi:pyrroline-5-carboxylate reductase